MLHYSTSNATPSSSHRRRTSRSNSASSSSIVTVHRAASHSSRPASRNTFVKGGNTSPVGPDTRLGALTPATSETALERSTSTAHNRSSSAGGIKDGVGSINRWSQSTASSRSPPQSANKSRGGFSRKSSVGSLIESWSPPRNLTHSQSPSSRSVLSTLRDSPRKVSQHSILPPEVKTPPTFSPSFNPSIDLIASFDITTSAPSSTPIDYFEDHSCRRTPEAGTGRNPQGTVGEPVVGSAAPNLGTEFQRVETVQAPSAHTDHNLDRSGDRASRVLYPHSRGENTKGSISGDTTGASSRSSTGKEKDRDRQHRIPSQKAMLSKALQKANTAVLLDNAANFEGAIEAYSDACHLLQLVMQRSNGGNDEKLKLQEIRNTYISRINELRQLDLSSQQSDGKALPERPLSGQSFAGDAFQSFEGDEGDAARIETDTAAQIINKSSHSSGAGEPRILAPSRIPPRRQSLLPSAFDEDLRYMASSPKSERPTFHSRSDSNKHEVRSEHSLNPAPLSEDCYMPSPLSPRRPYSPGASFERTDRANHLSHYQLQHSRSNQQVRDVSNESTSWLDTIDESGASSPSSTLSKMSSLYLRRRQSRANSNATEAEFDAALDAAVEAAYDEGLEPATDAYDGFLDDDDDDDDDDDVVSNARRNVELAKQRAREAEREAQVAMARGREKRRIEEETMLGHSDALDSDYVDEEAEEEERLLEEMTKGYVMDDFEFDLQSKSALPRQSDSSSFSGRTWGSSVASNTTTAGASLSTLAEGIVLPSLDSKMQSKKLPPPPPVSTLPPPPIPSSSPPTLPLQSAPSPSTFGSPGGGVRARRLSGQNPKELKIETNTRVPAGSQAPKTEPPSMPAASPPPPPPRDEPKTSFPVSPSNESRTPYTRTLYGRNGSIDSFAGESPTAVPLTKFATRDSDDLGRSGAPSPSRPIGRLPSGPEKLRKNVSSSSLRALRARNMSISTPEVSTDSPGTPSSITFPSLDLQKGMPTGVVPTLPTPTGAHFTPNGLPTGGLYLFDSNIHSPTSPGSPNPMAANAPIPLEPCPESFLLRPFWLMRCLYQTIAHPRGGYLSTKLFVPRDVWRVKNVKIKAVEEKVSNCDLLTAALLKLAQVDTYDADAVLEEMQSLENVLDQVQASLSKKLGNEVGVQGSMQLFKSTAASEDAAQASESSSLKTSSGSGKSYLTSWRKLRSKNSGLNATTLSSSKESGKDNLTMSTLPMTATPSTRVAKRDVTQLQFTGPNATYMGALARLFDAVQVLDQIARQVEDPGLKHSSPTLVGLELSTRHAAEFFGFYVCRFALNDVSMMLDKFIKRGSEWVLI